MFGVNSSGEDTLAPQFRRGGEGGSEWGRSVERDEGFKIAVEGNTAWLRKIGFEKIRERILTELRTQGILPSVPEINTLVEKEIHERAVRLAEQGREEQQRLASGAAILRVAL